MPGLREGETILRVAEVLDYLKSCGLTIPRTAIYTWFDRGLDHGRAGGTFVTSREAIWRFLNRSESTTETTLTADDLERSREAAKRLDKAGARRREKAATK